MSENISLKMGVELAISLNTGDNLCHESYVIMNKRSKMSFNYCYVIPREQNVRDCR